MFNPCPGSVTEPADEQTVKSKLAKIAVRPKIMRDERELPIILAQFVSRTNAFRCSVMNELLKVVNRVQTIVIGSRIILPDCILKRIPSPNRNSGCPGTI